MTQAVARKAQPDEHVLRGSPSRLKDFQEQFQTAAFNAMAAAAGCVTERPGIDEGVDLRVTHRIPTHLHEIVVLEVQLKCSSRRISPKAEFISVQLDSDRYDYLRTVSPILPKILIVMSVPSTRDEWVRQATGHLALRHVNYWANLEGAPAATVAKPSVRVPIAQRLDDVALYEMMARIGQGGKP